MPYRWKDARLDLLNSRVAQADDTVTGDVTAVAGQLVVCTNTTAITVTLPASPTANTRVGVVRAGTGAVTVDGNGETIIGATTQTLPLQYDAMQLVYFNDEWLVI